MCLQSGVGRIFSTLLAPTNSSGAQAGNLAPTLQREQDAWGVEAAVPYSSHKGNYGHAVCGLHYKIMTFVMPSAMSTTK